MVSKINSLGINGIGGYKVSVECSISQGLPGFEIVGLPDMAVRDKMNNIFTIIAGREILCRQFFNL